MNSDDLLASLNPQQKEAVLYTDGPLLVLAGAGSGKTRLITHKFIYLLKEKIDTPSSILTVTFTNKAAKEMKDRIRLVLCSDLTNCWIGTFHSQCCRILRREIQRLGYEPNFVIYSEDDREALIRHILKELNMYEALYKGVSSRISALKASLITPERFLSESANFGFDEKLAKVYVRYQDELKRSNALDFDDLIMLTVQLFQQYPSVLEKYQEQFRYILVDEFQDTNSAQYELIRLLAMSHGSISAVGDDDQSIYRFRGAEPKNIYKFERDFPETRVIKLEQNYRSTQTILDASGSVIAKNPDRKEKRLWTDRGAGEHVRFYWLPSEEEEAKFVARKIKDIYLKGTYSFGDIAVLYRINLQSRVIEDYLRKERIPYKVVGSVSFYDRKEIKDLLAYLKIIQNPRDNVSLRRIINVPQRGIGAATINRIETVAKKKGVSLYEAIEDIVENRNSSQKIIDRLSSFKDLIESLIKKRNDTVSETLKEIIETTGYAKELEEERLQNIAELIVSTEDTSLKDFLENVSLITSLDDEVKEDRVSIMTIHMAKGLEFPVVFIVGLEEGLLPYFRAKSAEDICEERRLFYVAMTRAKEMLYLSGAKKRRIFSKLQEQRPSRFLEDIPRNCCKWVEKSRPVETIQKSCKTNGKKTSSLPYKTGCRVRHPKWGIGVVRDCYGEGEDAKVCVNFPTVGLKKLKVKQAPLEKI